MASQALPLDNDCKYNSLLFPVKRLVEEARSGNLQNLTYDNINGNNVLSDFLNIAKRQTKLCMGTDWRPYMPGQPQFDGFHNKPGIDVKPDKVQNRRELKKGIESSIDGDCVYNWNATLGERFYVGGFEEQNVVYRESEIRYDAFSILLENAVSELTIDVYDRKPNMPVLVKFEPFKELREEGSFTKESKTIRHMGTEKQKREWKDAWQNLEEASKMTDESAREIAVQAKWDNIHRLGAVYADYFNRTGAAWRTLAKTFDSDNNGNYRFVTPLAMHKNYRYKMGYSYARRGRDAQRRNVWNNGNRLPGELHLRNASDSIAPTSQRAKYYDYVKNMVARDDYTFSDLMPQTQNRARSRAFYNVSNADMNESHEEYMNRSSTAEYEDVGEVDAVVVNEIGYSFC
tara:strand:- start:903 stop:2108 length:1206 start_codon:yes stop_codon:yes gene_type:complete